MKKGGREEGGKGGREGGIAGGIAGGREGGREGEREGGSVIAFCCSLMRRQGTFYTSNTCIIIPTCIVHMYATVAKGSPHVLTFRLSHSA